MSRADSPGCPTAPSCGPDVLTFFYLRRRGGAAPLLSKRLTIWATDRSEGDEPAQDHDHRDAEAAEHAAQRHALRQAFVVEGVRLGHLVRGGVGAEADDADTQRDVAAYGEGQRLRADLLVPGDGVEQLRHGGLHQGSVVLLQTVEELLPAGGGEVVHDTPQ